LVLGRHTSNDVRMLTFTAAGAPAHVVHSRCESVASASNSRIIAVSIPVTCTPRDGPGRNTDSRMRQSCHRS
jgi:hypothetical protein